MAEGQKKPPKVQVEYAMAFTTYMDTLPERITTTLEIVGGMVESIAKARCPVDTGTLRDSITHFMEEGKTNTVIIGTPVEYAPYVELGHSQQPGRFVPKIGKRLKASFVKGKPYLRPAVEEHLEDIKKVMRIALGIENPIPQSEEEPPTSEGNSENTDQDENSQDEES